MKRLTQLVLVVLLGTCSAFANSIGFTLSSIASGTIGGTSFSDATFTIHGHGDTSHVVSFGSGDYFLDLGFATIKIQGVGTFSFTTSTRFFSDSGGLVGFSRAGVDGYDLIEGPFLSPWNWNMQTSVGLVTGDGYITQWNLSPVLTNGGVLVLNDSDTQPFTFSAKVGSVVTPEPGTICLLVTGLASIAGQSLARKMRR